MKFRFKTSMPMYPITIAVLFSAIKFKIYYSYYFLVIVHIVRS